MKELITIKLFGGTVLAFPVEQKDVPGSHYELFLESLSSSRVWLEGENRWMGAMPIESIDLILSEGRPNADAPKPEPYAIEAGFSNGDGTYSVSIERLPLEAWEVPVKDYPQRLLYAEQA